MALARTCDACKAPIPGLRVLELGLRLLRTDQGDHQDALEEWNGDYCRSCLRSGRALQDLLGAFTKYPQHLAKEKR